MSSESTSAATSTSTPTNVRTTTSVNLLVNIPNLLTGIRAAMTMYDGLQNKSNCTSCSKTDEAPKLSLEDAFTAVQRIDNYSETSRLIIETCKRTIAENEKLLEQDKVNRATAMTTLLAEAVKFNAEHPNDPLDTNFDAPIMFKQYTYLKSKFADVAARTTNMTSATVPAPVSATVPTVAPTDSLPTVTVPTVIVSTVSETFAEQAASKPEVSNTCSAS